MRLMISRNNMNKALIIILMGFMAVHLFVISVIL